MSIMALVLVFLTILSGAAILIGTILGWALCNAIDHVIDDERIEQYNNNTIKERRVNA